MITKRQAAWQSFSDFVAAHIRETDEGQYAGEGMIQPMDFCESFAGEKAKWIWWNAVIRHVTSFITTGRERELYKAAHYLCRLWVIRPSDRLNP